MGTAVPRPLNLAETQGQNDRETGSQNWPGSVRVAIFCPLLTDPGGPRPRCISSNVLLESFLIQCLFCLQRYRTHVKYINFMYIVCPAHSWGLKMERKTALKLQSFSSPIHIPSLQHPSSTSHLKQWMEHSVCSVPYCTEFYWAHDCYRLSMHVFAHILVPCWPVVLTSVYKSWWNSCPWQGVVIADHKIKLKIFRNLHMGR